MSQRFAAIDFETTGINAATNRVIEIGIVVFDQNGTTIEEYESLINAGRDVGRTDIHGISATQLLEAPAFGEIAGDIIGLLNGSILIAHNKAFDIRFLRRELELIGIQIASVEGLCTMELMSMTFADSPRQLTKCCEYLKIEVGVAHTALDDARMSANIAKKILKDYGYPALPDPMAFNSRILATKNPVPRGRGTNPQKTQGGYLASLIAKLPQTSPRFGKLAAMAAQYLNLLERCIEDRILSANEADALQQLALHLELTTDQVHMIHATFLASLVRIALLDGEIDIQEDRDLEMVTKLLNFEDWREIVNQTSSAANNQLTAHGLIAGSTVCFTGSMSLPRSRCESVAQQKGLTIRDRVTKDLDILVVADPFSQSNKANAARRYGTRIMSEIAFFNLLGFLGGSDETSKSEKRPHELGIKILIRDSDEDTEDAALDSEEASSKLELIAMLDSLKPFELSEEKVMSNLDVIKQVSQDAERESGSYTDLTNDARLALIDLYQHLRHLAAPNSAITSDARAEVQFLGDFTIDSLNAINISEKKQMENTGSFLGPYWDLRWLSITFDAWQDKLSRLKPSEFVEFEHSLDFGDSRLASLLSGKSIVLTGNFLQFSREEGQDSIKKRGGKSPTSVSGKTYALVVGDQPGESKFAKSVENGIPILDYEGFVFMLKNGYIRGTNPNFEGSVKLRTDTPAAKQKPKEEEVIESFLCMTCNTQFERVRTKGRKPHECPSCRGKIV